MAHRVSARTTRGWVNLPRSAHRRPGPPPPARGGPARGRPDNYYCPDEKENPDWDFSAGAILVDQPNGRSLALGGEKSGGVWALDPDNKGAVVLWYSDISRGQILFGGAADEEQAYFALRGTYGGLAAIRLKDGLERWFADIPPQESMAQHPGLSAAVSVIPGVVFSAGLDGMLRAFSSFDAEPFGNTTRRRTSKPSTASRHAAGRLVQPAPRS